MMDFRWTQFNTIPLAAVLAGFEAALLVRTPGNSDLVNWVSNGGLLISEWDAAGWVLNTANLLDADESGGAGSFGTPVPVTFTEFLIGCNLETDCQILMQMMMELSSTEI